MIFKVKDTSRVTHLIPLSAVDPQKATEILKTSEASSQARQRYFEAYREHEKALAAVQSQGTRVCLIDHGQLYLASFNPNNPPEFQ
jgi:hypothetical protein